MAKDDKSLPVQQAGPDKAGAKEALHAAHEAHASKSHPHAKEATHAFVRVGGQAINLAHVVSVDLAVGDDPKHPLTLHFVHGRATSLIGDDAAKVMGALGVDA